MKKPYILIAALFSVLTVGICVAIARPIGVSYFDVIDVNSCRGCGPGGTVIAVTGTPPIASSGGNSPVISLNDTAVTPGSYTYSSITVDQKGRLTAASNGAAPGTVTGVTGTPPIASSGGNTPAISLNNTAVTPGSYTNSNITVDAQGRLTAASNGSTSVSGISHIPFATGSQTALNIGGLFGAVKLASNGTIQNCTAAADSFSCAGNPVFVLEDCGASTTCTSPTVKCTITLTAVNTIVTVSPSSASLTSGNFYAWEETGGSCTLLRAGGTAIY